MSEKLSDSVLCKVEPSDVENNMTTEDVVMTKGKFNILDLLDSGNKQWVIRLQN